MKDIKFDKIMPICRWVVTTLWAMWVLLLSALPQQMAESNMTALANGLLWLTTAVLGDLNTAAQGVFLRLVPLLVPAVLYALLAAGVWRSLRTSGWRQNSSLALGGALCVLLAVLGGLSRALMQYTSSAIWVQLVCEWAGAGVMLLCIGVFCWAWRRFPKLINRETVGYAVCGVGTTLIDLVLFFVCGNLLLLHYLIGNSVAWVGSTLFAYVSNKLWVFRGDAHTPTEILREAGRFCGVRVFSLCVNQVLLFLMIGTLHISDGIAKVLGNIVVLIINFFLSKSFIFKKA